MLGLKEFAEEFFLKLKTPNIDLTFAMFKYHQ